MQEVGQLCPENAGSYPLSLSAEFNLGLLTHGVGLRALSCELESQEVIVHSKKQGPFIV